MSNIKNDKKAEPSPREMAAKALMKATDERAFSNIAIEETLNLAPNMSAQDRAFFSRLIKQTLESLYLIDAIIKKHASLPPKKMNPYILATLRIAVCQILYFDRTPARAAVNEAVSNVKKSKYCFMSGFVNAVLRSVAGDKDREKLADMNDNPIGYLSFKYSMPRWITKHFINLYGFSRTEEMFRYFSSDPGVMVRINLSRFSRDNMRLNDTGREADEKSCLSPIDYVKKTLTASGISFRESVYPECIRLERAGKLTELKLFNDGLLTVQDLSSYIAIDEACEEFIRRYNTSADKGENIATVYDICAAPGGKTLACAEIFELKGIKAEFSAFDISEKKCAKMRENIARMGYENIRAAVRDAKQTLAESIGIISKRADLLICDVPCSGLGVLARKKEIRYRLKEEDIRSLVSLQREFLDAADTLLKSGGLMLYSTCTVNPAENSEQTSYLASSGKYRIIKERQLLPGIDGCDGLYYALLRKL